MGIRRREGAKQRGERGGGMAEGWEGGGETGAGLTKRRVESP